MNNNNLLASYPTPDAYAIKAVNYFVDFINDINKRWTTISAVLCNVILFKFFYHFFASLNLLNTS